MLTLISFLGGSAFRLIFGGILNYLNKRQEHQQELDTIRLQNEMDEAKNKRDMDRLRLQGELGIKEVQVVGDIAEQKAAADAFIEAVKATGVKTGISWVDAWNASIRPAGATLSLLVWVISMIAAFYVAGATIDAIHSALTDFDKTLIAAFLGVFVGERIHNKLGK